MDSKVFSLTSYHNIEGNKTGEIISLPRIYREDSNMSVKADMADELQRMGLPASAISRLLNVTCHRR